MLASATKTRSICCTCGFDPPSVCAACREADQRKARGEQPCHADINWRHADVIPRWENMSVDGLWAEVNWRVHKGHGAPQSTYQALLWELREYGIAQLQKADCRRRLADLSTKQLRD